MGAGPREAIGRWTRRAALAASAGVLLAPALSEVRIARPLRCVTNDWNRITVAPRGDTTLGISFRPRQCEALGLDAAQTMRTLLPHPFGMIRLGAYWDRMEPVPGRFNPEELDWQVDAAEAAGKQIIIAVGAIKTFGYPEFFVPAHHLPEPLPEGSLVTPATHPALLEAAEAFVGRVIERYRERKVVVAWQVEHEAVDPLGLEHSWRLSTGFVRREVVAARAADPSRPIVLNGYLPTSLPVRVDQWMRTRDQGDSLALAQDLADVLGIDYYPRHGLISLAGRTIYLDGAARRWEQARPRHLFKKALATGRRAMVTEGQAEPWEAVTVPPSPQRRAMYSCPPERLITNYNQAMSWASPPAAPWAYLFWGADYWVLRQLQGDTSYLRAFARVLQES